MSDGVLDAHGQLIDDLKPAIYFDASVLIDYWVTEGMEVERDSEWEPADPPHEVLLRELLRADRRVAGMLDVRKALLFNEPTCVAVTSALALLEVIEWYAQSAIKNLSANAAGAQAVQRMGQKDVGQLLRRIIEDRKSEAEQRESGPKHESTPLDILVGETFIGSGFARAHGLAGILVADVVNFGFTERDAWGASEVLAYLQMGMADIVHLLLARHLGCRWVASFDSDFVRCRDHISEGLGLSLLSTPEEIHAVVAASPCA